MPVPACIACSCDSFTCNLHSRRPSRWVARPCLPPALACPACSDPKRNTTRCLEDFALTCDRQRGCAGCALWRSVETNCTAGGAAAQQRDACLPRPTYVLMRSQETDRATGQPCQTAKHWMLVPRIPCTGVESPDPACEPLAVLPGSAACVCWLACVASQHSAVAGRFAWE